MDEVDKKPVKRLRVKSRKEIYAAIKDGLYHETEYHKGYRDALRWVLDEKR